MEHGTSDSGTRLNDSYDRTTSSANSSLRRRSFCLSGPVSGQTEEDIGSEIVSEVGDIGDRALHSNRYSDSGNLLLSVDNMTENGVVVSVSEDAQLESREFWSHDPKTFNTSAIVAPLPADTVSPLSIDVIVCSEEKKQDNVKVLPRSLEYISSLTHLAVFGILGVLTRYLLQKLFAPGVAGVTSDQSILYLDLPSNMVGSFLMGWWGVVFKADISHVSEYLAIGMTTGYLGSLTTFSGWNQKMLDLSVNGQWVLSVLGFLIGLFLAAYSIIFGVETAKGFKWLLTRINLNSRYGLPSSSSSWRVDSRKCHSVVIVVLMLMLGLLWSLSGTLFTRDFNRGSSTAQLWLGCMVAPLGVWIRWFLARLNGRGLGRTGLLKWVPFGTLIANVSAACVMAALSTTKKAVNTKNCDTMVTGIQFGLLGCLSTVSTFMAEFNAMRQSKQPWRAYAYATFTIGVSFTLGVLIYSVPVLAKGYS